MLHVGLDLSRKRIDVCLISDQGELIDRFTAIPDRAGLYGLARRLAVYGEAVRAVVESMNGARFVHDELVAHGWEVLVADAQKVKGLAPQQGPTSGGAPPTSPRLLAACRGRANAIAISGVGVGGVMPEGRLACRLSQHPRARNPPRRFD